MFYDYSKNKIIIGDTQYLDISFNLINTGYSSYKTTLTLAYPNVLLFFKISKVTKIVSLV